MSTHPARRSPLQYRSPEVEDAFLEPPRRPRRASQPCSLESHTRTISLIPWHHQTTNICHNSQRPIRHKTPKPTIRRDNANPTRWKFAHHIAFLVYQPPLVSGSSTDSAATYVKPSTQSVSRVIHTKLFPPAATHLC